jgi:hypothetical protein
MKEGASEMGKLIVSTGMEDRLKTLKPNEVSALYNRGWWEVTIFVWESGSYTGGKDRSYFGALQKTIDYTVKEQAKERKED